MFLLAIVGAWSIDFLWAQLIHWILATDTLIDLEIFLIRLGSSYLLVFHWDALTCARISRQICTSVPLHDLAAILMFVRLCSCLGFSITMRFRNNALFLLLMGFLLGIQHLVVLMHMLIISSAISVRFELKSNGLVTKHFVFEVAETNYDHSHVV